MASSGKKGKKNKGTVISLQSFLSNGDTPAGTTQVSKKVRNLDGDESDDGGNSLPQVYQLPTAPRANRIFDDDSIPHKPPFIAYVNNLPFDANEDDVYDFFGNINLVSLRLPREDGETGRSRGFGYVELESRDDLIHVLSLPDPSIKGRRIRIELSNENEQQNNRQRGNRRFEGFGNSSENRDSGNWRRDGQNNSSSGGGGYNTNYDRGFNRDRERKNVNSDDNGGPGSWRTNIRSQVSDFSPPRRDYGGDRYREGRVRNNDRDDRPIAKEESLQERPKLNLKPRTLPLPEIVTIPEQNADAVEVTDETPISKPSGVTAEKVFGSAKPVDTAARELEIEERLAEARRQDKFRQDQQEEAGEEDEENEAVKEKLSEIQIEKTDKENANSSISWRRTTEVTVANRTDTRRISPGRNDDRRRDKKDGVYNKYNKNRDRNERPDNLGKGSNQNKDSKLKDDIKSKREPRPERPLPKLQPNQPGSLVLQSSNKYSGLDDEASE